MPDPLEQLIESLLFEGYALYPYTSGATKNSTPTPFGIVYPPAYAQELPSTFDHLLLRCGLVAAADALLSADVALLVGGGERHKAVAHRLQLRGGMVGALAAEAAEKQLSITPPEGPPLVVGLHLSAEQTAPESYEVTLRIENRTVVRSGLDRAGALNRSLLSTHPVLRVLGGRFVSPLDRPYDSVNTFPVLATPQDDAIVGAAIVLPDHPQIAPESRGSLFDSTEIEEALLLHVQVLSDDELADIEQQDPTIREMVNRAAAATPADIVALHGRVTLRDPQTNEPPTEPEGLFDPHVGEDVAEADGKTFRPGCKVLIRPGPDADIQARMLDGRTATVERITTAYDGKTHLGVTIDGDPGQEIMRETGRLLYFFAPEVEVIDG
jgi:hypothetical protein